MYIGVKGKSFERIKKNKGKYTRKTCILNFSMKIRTIFIINIKFCNNFWHDIRNLVQNIFWFIAINMYYLSSPPQAEARITPHAITVPLLFDTNFTCTNTSTYIIRKPSRNNLLMEIPYDFIFSWTQNRMKLGFIWFRGWKMRKNTFILFKFFIFLIFIFYILFLIIC